MLDLKTSKIGDAAKLLGEKWQKMSDDQKQPYTKMSTADGLRHDKHVEELKEKGYFTLEDGSKSTDPKKSKIVKKRTHEEAKNQDLDSLADEAEDGELDSLIPNSKKQKVN